MLPLSSFIIALAALWIARDTWRKSTSHVITLENVEHICRGQADKPGFCHFFSAYLKNVGLPVQDMTANISFTPQGSLGRFSCPLNIFDMQSEQVVTKRKTIARGLVVKIGWRSIDFGPGDLSMLTALTEPTAQKAQLSIYSAGYFLKSFRIGGARDRIAMKINGIVHDLFRRCQLGFYARKQGPWRSRIRMPQRQNIMLALQSFLSEMRKVHTNNAVQHDAENPTK